MLLAVAITGTVSPPGHCDVDGAVRGHRHAEGSVADGDGRGHRVAPRRDHRDVEEVEVRDVDVAAVRGHRHAGKGKLPTGMVAATVVRAVSITETVSSNLFPT